MLGGPFVMGFVVGEGSPLAMVEMNSFFGMCEEGFPSERKRSPSSFSAMQSWYVYFLSSSITF